MFPMSYKIAIRHTMIIRTVALRRVQALLSLAAHAMLTQ